MQSNNDSRKHCTRKYHQQNQSYHPHNSVRYQNIPYRWNNRGRVHFDRKKRKPFCCVNCGKEGHVYKECKEPITSFGILAMWHLPFEIANNLNSTFSTKYRCNKHLSIYPDSIPERESDCKVLYLMVQRKDTMGFIDFIRGKYPENDDIKKNHILRTYLHEMTCEERDLLTKHDFEDLWDLLWLNKYSMLYMNEYMDAKRKFSQLNVLELVNSTECQWTEQEYGFPKGRKNMYETNMECAKREFREESGYTPDQIRIISDKPWEENFVGTNGIRYRHVYYIAEILSGQEIPKIPLKDVKMAGEISNYNWFSYEQCMQVIRPYDVAKKELLTKVHAKYDK
jgi:ADP-ribose pyrophosphatase YjhB (NUDIX family)